MIVSIDVSQLEWRVAALLSQDATMIAEITEGVDAHSYNCEHILKLPVTPENRTATKVFTFRMIQLRVTWGVIPSIKLG